jgi:hypothetical protein
MFLLGLEISGELRADAERKKSLSERVRSGSVSRAFKPPRHNIVCHSPKPQTQSIVGLDQQEGIAIGVPMPADHGIDSQQAELGRHSRVADLQYTAYRSQNERNCGFSGSDSGRFQLKTPYSRIFSAVQIEPHAPE